MMIKLNITWNYNIFVYINQDENQNFVIPKCLYTTGPWSSA